MRLRHRGIIITITSEDRKAGKLYIASYAYDGLRFVTSTYSSADNAFTLAARKLNALMDGVSVQF